VLAWRGVAWRGVAWRGVAWDGSCQRRAVAGCMLHGTGVGARLEDMGSEWAVGEAPVSRVAAVAAVSVHGAVLRGR
jgi:hypothetical protein